LKVLNLLAKTAKVTICTKMPMLISRSASNQNFSAFKIAGQTRYSKAGKVFMITGGTVVLKQTSIAKIAIIYKLREKILPLMTA